MQQRKNIILAYKLKTLRKSRKLTQEQVSIILGLNRSTYAYYETGRHIPNIFTLQQIAILYGISMDSLLRATKKNADQY
ncbi:MAG: helix-turn-helix domain-containing protein [Oscillospiraceae bacterium]|jgi:transcriptional regulator with XRE-family HTH domain|nr:helix-turn-helix domain-containing protein [Oscillospiraceae bacterium]